MTSLDEGALLVNRTSQSPRHLRAAGWLVWSRLRDDASPSLNFHIRGNAISGKYAFFCDL